MKKNTVLLFVFLFFLSPPVFAQQNAEVLLNEVITNYQKVSDYQAEIIIETDIPFINILPMKAKLYFQQPDRMRIISKGITILPRQGFDEMYKALIDRKSYTMIQMQNDTVEGIKTHVISILPLTDTMEIILGKFWIDPVRKTILKSQITTRTNGTVIASYFYGNYSGYGLPDRISFTVEVKKFKIPKAVAVDITSKSKASSAKTKDLKKGKIDIRFSEYKINKGLSSSVFRD